MKSARTPQMGDKGYRIYLKYSGTYANDIITGLIITYSNTWREMPQSYSKVIHSFEFQSCIYLGAGAVRLQNPAKTLPKIDWHTLETAHGTAVRGFPKCWVARTTPSTEFWNIKWINQNWRWQLHANKWNWCTSPTKLLKLALKDL